MTAYKIATSVQFMALAADAVAKGYNRQLDLNQLAEVLDPVGVEICSFSMEHEHIAGVRVDPHMRTMWLIKVKGKPATKPESVTLDISMENFNALTVHESKSA